MTTYVARLVKSNTAKIEADAAACLFYTSCRWELVQYNSPVSSVVLVIHDGEFAGVWSIVKGPVKWLGHNGYTFQRVNSTGDALQLWDIAPRDVKSAAVEIVDAAIEVVNACTTEAEIHTFTNSIDFAPWTSEMVAALTDAVEARIAVFKVRCATCGSDGSPCVDCNPIKQVPQPHKHRETVINRAIAKNYYITDGDVANSHTLRDVAMDFVQSYKGRNSFVQDLALRLTNGGALSHGQMRGALNVMVREARQELATPSITLEVYGQPQQGHTHHAEGRAAVSSFYVDMRPYNTVTSKLEEAVKPVDLSDDPHYTTPTLDRVVPNGTYTVPINDRGEYRVIELVDCPEKFNKPAGTQIARYQIGASNETDFEGFAFVSGADHRLWKRFLHNGAIDHALNKLLTLGKHAEFGKLWAMASGNCFICGRKLTVPISKQAGIGPICAENAGIDIHALAALDTDKINRATRARLDIDELFPE